MQLRQFGNTDLMVSEVGFGSWAIGGQSFGPVPRDDALNALARAEELGCNLIDTAAVYGEAESVIGQFLTSRRDKWILATKYSGQEGGIRRTLERQLRTLGTDVIDFYQLHWMPSRTEDHLIEELAALRQEGKVRYIGASLYSADDLERALTNPHLDGLQLKISLLSPSPFHEYRDRIRDSGKGLLARSSLEAGFLTGKYDASASFPAPGDKRAELTTGQIQQLAERARAFGALCDDNLSLLLLATRYVLAHPQVSSLLLSTKHPAQADVNFSQVPAAPLPPETIRRIERLQKDLRLFEHPGLLRKLVRALRRWASRH